MALFRCEKCSHEEWRHNDRGRIEEPKKCPEPNCNEQWSMSMIHNRCAFYNKQIVKMQVSVPRMPGRPGSQRHHQKALTDTPVLEPLTINR